MLNSRDIDRLRPDVAANCRAWLELCRAADADTKKAAVSLLKRGILRVFGYSRHLLGGSGSGKGDLLGTLPDGVIDVFGKK